MISGRQWLRVTKYNPCAICGKSDWCLISQDGKAAICARIESDKQAGNAGWLHKLTGDIKPLPLPPKPNAKQSPIALAEVRDLVYRALLGELSLSKYHQENLLSRGLTADQISALEYKTLPRFRDRDAIVRRLPASLKVGGVPGFALVDGEIQLCGSPGILIPVRDIEGCIQGEMSRS